MSTQQININVVSANAISPDDESEIRSTLEASSSASVLKALAQAWKAENDGQRMSIAMPEGKGTVSDSLKFKEFEFLKELIVENLTVDDDRRVVIRLSDDQLTKSRVAELYSILTYVGTLVEGWESDSEFSWEDPGVGTSSFFWEGDGQVFPESDFN